MWCRPLPLFYSFYGANWTGSWLILELFDFFILWLRFGSQFFILRPYSIISLIDIQITLHSGFHSFKLFGMIDDIDSFREELL